MPALSPGARFAGYVVEGVIARGGMGVVYRAREARPERTVALKIVAPELAADTAFRIRFLRECQLAAAIEHPHAVPVLRVGEEDGQLFIAMRLIHGADLAAVIRTEGCLAPPRIVRIIEHVAEALDAAHEQGLVHRDVKPANILVELHARTEYAYLADFGLTKNVSSLSGFTSTGMIVGTVDYMAPEQIEGKRLDARSDVYSLGCVLYEGLTGQVPYPLESQTARMWAHIATPPPSVSSVVEGDWSTFDEVIRHALAKQQDERYASAGDLARAAAAALVAGGKTVVGSPRAAAREPPTEVETRLRAPAGTGPRPSAETGTKPSAETGTKRSAETGTKPSAGTGTKPSAETGTKLSAETGTKPSAGTGAKLSAETGPPRPVAMIGGRRRVRVLAAVGAIAVIGVIVAAATLLGGSGGGRAAAMTPQALAGAWLRYFDAGANASAAALWATPASVRADFPAYTGSFTTTDQIQQWTARQGCQLRRDGPIAPDGSVAVMRVTAVGPRTSPGATACEVTGTDYSYRFTASDGRITTLASVMTPRSVVFNWIVLRNTGHDSLSAQLWTPPAKVQTVLPTATFVLRTPGEIERFWASRGCIYTEIGSGRLRDGVLAIRLDRGGTRPSPSAGPCSESGTTFVAHVTVAGSRITRLIETAGNGTTIQ
jgi:serine/threonine protein kinase